MPWASPLVQGAPRSQHSGCSPARPLSYRSRPSDDERGAAAGRRPATRAHQCEHDAALLSCPGPGGRGRSGACRTSPHDRHLPTAAISSGTCAQTSPGTPPHPSPKGTAARSGPAHTRTPRSCVPAAMSSASSRFLLPEKPNRTNHVLPKANRSCSNEILRSGGLTVGHSEGKLGKRLNKSAALNSVIRAVVDWRWTRPC